MPFTDADQARLDHDDTLQRQKRETSAIEKEQRDMRVLALDYGMQLVKEILKMPGATVTSDFVANFLVETDSISKYISNGVVPVVPVVTLAEKKSNAFGDHLEQM